MTGLLGAFLLLLSGSSCGLAWTFYENGGSLDDPTPYPYPRIILMGPSGVGKSTLANLLSGCLPNDNSCFETCAGVDSCTQETSINVVTYLGDDAYGSSTLTDTPGFGDSGVEGDGPIITNIIEALKHNLGDANIILLCIDYSQRFGPDLQNMIAELESLFGRSQVWDHVAIEVTKWKYTEDAIKDRNRTGVTEESALHDINQKIMDISHLNQSLPGVFIDSFAAFPEEQEDETQQFYFKKYTQELWDLALATPTLQFLSIEDILAELSECRSANDCLTEVLEGRMTQVESDVMKNKAQISINGVMIIQNGAKITTNIDAITNNSDVIRDHSDAISTNLLNIHSNSNKINLNTGAIDANNANIVSNSGNINSNTNKINLNTGAIDANNANIGSNRGNINSNTNKINLNTGAIDANNANIVSNSGNINSLSNKINLNTGAIDANNANIGSNSGNINSNTNKINLNTKAIDALEIGVGVCGYKYRQTGTGLITYDRHSGTSTDGSNISTTTGKYTVKTQGLYSITYSAHTYGQTYIYLYKDGSEQDDTRYYSYQGSDDSDQGSFTVVRCLTERQEIHLEATTNTKYIYSLQFCVTLLSEASC